MLFINFAGKGTNKRVIIQIYIVFLSFLCVFIYSEQKKHHPSAEIQIITKFWRLSFVVSGIFCNFVGDND